MGASGGCLPQGLGDGPTEDRAEQGRSQPAGCCPRLCCCSPQCEACQSFDHASSRSRVQAMARGSPTGEPKDSLCTKQFNVHVAESAMTKLSPSNLSPRTSSLGCFEGGIDDLGHPEYGFLFVLPAVHLQRDRPVRSRLGVVCANREGKLQAQWSGTAQHKAHKGCRCARPGRSGTRAAGAGRRRRGRPWSQGRRQQKGRTGCRDRCSTGSWKWEVVRSVGRGLGSEDPE